MVANYVAAGKLLLRDGKVEGCTVRDTVTGEVFDIRARTVLVAAGPWADLFLEQATGEVAHRLIRSKGIHLLMPQISQSALTIEAGAGHLFALPWRGHTLLATTDTEFSGDPATRRRERETISTASSPPSGNICLPRRWDASGWNSSMRASASGQ